MLYSVHCSLQGALNSAKGGVGCLCVDLAAASTLTAARGGRQGAAVRRGAAAAAGGQRHQRVTCMHTWMFTREEWPVVGMAGSVEGGGDGT